MLVYTANKFSPQKSAFIEDEESDDDDFEADDQVQGNRVKRSVSSYYTYNHDQGHDNKEVKFIDDETPMYQSRENLLQKQMQEFVRSGPKALTARKHVRFF